MKSAMHPLPHGRGSVTEPRTLASGLRQTLATFSLFACLGTLAATEPVRRLTHSQYNNAVRDLLNDQTRPADQFPPEDFVDGFKNQAQAQGISPLLAESYSIAAERLARNAFRGGDSNKLIPCKPTSARDRACAERFVRTFGRRAYRRPLAVKESTRLTELLLSEATAANDFQRGTQAVVEAILQSPNFLFRVEKAGSPYSAASKLAFFLWDTVPDEALLDAAAAGKLDVREAAARMVADPRAQQAIDQFLAQWMRFDLLLGAVKDRRLYPQFTPELAVAMSEETRLLAHHLIAEDRSFMEFFTADYAFLNTELAQLYKLPRPPGEFVKVSFPPGTERAGVLGQGAFLSLTSKPGETSPTVRGLFVREHFLCQKIPDPPPGTNSNLPTVTADHPRSNRERLGEHVANPACASCHNLIDPIGFGFEKFDAIGQRREKLRLTFMEGVIAREAKGPRPPAVEVELDTSGVLHGIPNSEFRSPRELGALLAKSPRCQDCIVRQLFRYAAGRRETSDDAETIAQAAEAFRRSQFRFRELMITIAALTAGRADQ